MITVTQSADIDAPPQKIWDHIADFNNWRQFTAAKLRFTKLYHDFRLAPGCAAGAGATVVMRRRNVNVSWTITDWAPPLKLAMIARERHLLGSFDWSLTITVSARTSLTTRVDIRFDFEPVGRLTNSLLGFFDAEKSFQEKAQEMLKRLKAALGN